MNTMEVLTLLLVVFAALTYIDKHGDYNNRDEMRSANLALISGRQMHRINACIFLVAITKRNIIPPPK